MQGETDIDLRVAVLLEEYRSLRQESLDTLAHRLSVVNFTFAAVSVVVAGMLSAAGSVPPAVIGLVGVVFVPQAAKAGLFIWLGEYERSQRAGRHLASLEMRINAMVPGEDDPGLTWESALTSKSQHMSWPYRATVAFTLGAGWASALLGMWYLYAAIRGAVQQPWSEVSAVAALAVLVAWEIVAVRTFFERWWLARGQAPG